MVNALKRVEYHQIQSGKLAPEYKMMSATQILENSDGFRWDIFLLKSVTERDDDEDDLLLLARSGLDWEAILNECVGQSRCDMVCEIYLYDKLDKLRTSYGLETLISDRISRISHEQMDKWFEDTLYRELDVNSMTLVELLERFRCDEGILLPTLANLERLDRIKKINDKYTINDLLN